MFPQSTEDRDDGERVVGFYALAAATVRPKDATDRLMRGRPEHPSVPAILIVGARAVIVDAISADAVHFYEQFGLEPSPTDSRRLILLMKDLRKLLAQS